MMTNNSKTNILFTPGPLSTTYSVKKAMLEDWGSRDENFIEMTRRVRSALERVIGVDSRSPSHACVLIQGSGTFAVEATLTSLVPRGGHVLVLVNGSYGHRIVDICKYHNRSVEVFQTEQHISPQPKELGKILDKNGAITDVFIVHCETTSGIINPIEDLSQVVESKGRRLFIDAMSSFGALPLDVKNIPCSAIVASSNKCLEGVPGIGFALVKCDLLENSQGTSSSLVLDLYDQWEKFEQTGEWRFTPPTHVVAALDQALIEHKKEGGVLGRYKRYSNNSRKLIKGMRSIGFKPYLSEELQSPIIVTFHTPKHKNFSFGKFYSFLKKRGFIIYPGKLTKTDSFRIGCMGEVGEVDILGLVSAVEEFAIKMGVEF